MDWNHYDTACSTLHDTETDETQTFLVVIQTPMLWYWLDRIVATTCRFTGYHYCTTPLMQYLHSLAIVRQEDFYVAVPDEVAVRYAHWRKWPQPVWESDDAEETANED